MIICLCFWLLVRDSWFRPALDEDHPQLDLIAHLVLIRIIVVILLDLVRRDNDRLLGFVSTHRLNNDALANLVPILGQRQVLGFEGFDECGPVAAVIVGNGIVDLLVDDGLRES